MLFFLFRYSLGFLLVIAQSLVCAVMQLSVHFTPVHAEVAYVRVSASSCEMKQTEKIVTGLFLFTLAGTQLSETQVVLQEGKSPQLKGEGAQQSFHFRGKFSRRRFKKRAQTYKEFEK